MNAYSIMDSFANWDEYDGFLTNLKSDSNWEQLEPYDSGEIDLGFLKTYLKNIETNEIWELVEPDPPFRGGWKKL